MRYALPLAVLLAVLLIGLLGCVPIPGSTINACIACIDSQASAHIGAPSPGAAEPALPEALATTPPLPGAGQGRDTNTTSGARDPDVTAPEPARPEPADAAVQAPTPAAPDADAGSGDTPAPAEHAGAPAVRLAEGLSLEPYPDTGGVQHICYGHRITAETCETLLEHDMARARAAAERVVGAPTWAGLTEPRRQVLAELAYMAGATGLSRFTQMLAAVRAGDFEVAATEITDSLIRPPTRAVRLAAMMREG